MKYTLLLTLLLLVTSCGQWEEKTEKKEISGGEVLKMRYARGFSLTKFENFSIIKVKDPWPESNHDFIYLLTEKGAKIPEHIEFDKKITIPVKKVVVTSTTHVPALEALGQENSLIGFPGLDYISSEKTRRRIDQGNIKELGKNENINTESLIDISPDLVMGFAIDGNNKTFENIQKTGIPVVFNGDWMEEDPLGKAEWIKFIGAFFNKTEEATAIFDSIEAEYLEAKKLAETTQSKPTVIGGSVYKDQWFMPYGNSWQARFFEDAGAEYLYQESTGEGSLALSFESVLEKAGEAEFWVSSGQVTSYRGLLEESRHYSQIRAVKEKKVYSVSLSKGDTGGVLYFELGPQRPDLILKDLISIFHPELLPDYSPRFYKALED